MVDHFILSFVIEQHVIQLGDCSPSTLYRWRKRDAPTFPFSCSTYGYPLELTTRYVEKFYRLVENSFPCLINIIPASSLLHHRGGIPDQLPVHYTTAEEYQTSVQSITPPRRNIRPAPSPLHRRGGISDQRPVHYTTAEEYQTSPQSFTPPRRNIRPAPSPLHRRGAIYSNIIYLKLPTFQLIKIKYEINVMCNFIIKY